MNKRYELNLSVKTGQNHYVKWTYGTAEEAMTELARLSGGTTFNHWDLVECIVDEEGTVKDTNLIGIGKFGIIPDFGKMKELLKQYNKEEAVK